MNFFSTKNFRQRSLIIRTISLLRFFIIISVLDSSQHDATLPELEFNHNYYKQVSLFFLIVNASVPASRHDKTKTVRVSSLPRV
jgi:hypothetical protein